MASQYRRGRSRRGVVWNDDDDARLLAIAGLPPKMIADLMQRTWSACRRRLSYLRSEPQRRDAEPRRLPR
jgi:hypothetical protein